MSKRGNTPVITIIIVLVLAAAAAFFFLSPNSSNTSLAPNSNNFTTNDVATSGSKYIEFTSSEYENIKNEDHILFFYANWCTTCRPIDAEFKRETDQLPLQVVRVNYNDSDTNDAEEALKDEYNVTYQHTFVYIVNGEEVARWSGGGIDAINAQIN